jgi:peptide/nickel transport system substrate-binding protein
MATSLAMAELPTSTPATAATRQQTILTEETNVGQIFTNNFNPADSQSTGTQMAINGLSFEPLIMYNALSATAWHPWIATSETLNPTGTQVTFTINPRATWSNGTPITAQDVANEFNVMSTNATMDVFGLPSLAQPARVSGTTVTLTYATPQFSNEQAFGSVLIFPVAGDVDLPTSSLIKSGNDTLSAHDVVGSGPYLPTSYTGQLIQYTYNSNWKLTPKPYVTGVNIPYYASNQAATEALVAGQLDWAGNDIPQITRTFVAMDPAHNHYFYPAGSTVTLWFNVSRSAPDGNTDCLADPAFRRIVSESINRQELALQGETGFESPATSSSGMLPSQAAYQGSFANDINVNGLSKSEVKTAMIAAGYTIDRNNFWQVTSPSAQSATGLAAGTECKFSIQDPTSYSDYFADIVLLAAQLKNVGVNASAVGVTTGQWNANIFTHNFDAIIRWGAGGANPYSQFQNWLADPAYTGGSTNFGSYTNTSAQADLIQLAASQPGSPNFQANVTKLASIISQDVPVAPILYGADWDVYSTRRFTGWVTSKNPYAYPGPGSNSIAYVVTTLKKS